MRVGPSRLISTAESSGESKATAAAEWMTMSQLAKIATVGVVEAEPVAADVAADGHDPAGDHLLERFVGAAPARRAGGRRRCS